MKSLTLVTLIVSTMASTSYGAQTILDCHVEGIGSDSLRIQSDLASAKVITGSTTFKDQRGQLITSRLKRFLDVSVNHYPHKNTCMSYTFFSAQDFSVQNDSCGNTRVFEGEFQGDKVVCVMNSLRD